AFRIIGRILKRGSGYVLGPVPPQRWVLGGAPSETRSISLITDQLSGTSYWNREGFALVIGNDRRCQNAHADAGPALRITPLAPVAGIRSGVRDHARPGNWREHRGVHIGKRGDAQVAPCGGS